jgi:hypothetical protein
MKARGEACLRAGLSEYGLSALAAKRLHRTAQGFSPGFASREIRPESGGRGASLGCFACYSSGVPNIGCHFQGTFY